MKNNTNSNNKQSAASGMKAVCVADLDSILHRGYDRQKRCPNPRGSIKVLEFTATLSASDVSIGTLCQNWSFGAIEEAIWEKVGLRCRVCSENADATVIAEAKAYAARSDISRIVLISNDGDYCPLVQELKNRGLEVEVWCRRASSSKQLRRLAHRVRYIDHLLSTHNEPSAKAVH